MSYEEKGAWVYLVVVIGTYAAYVVVVLRRADAVPLSDVAFVAPLLWSLGISMMASIVGRILIEILRPSDSYKVDARDKDIRRFGDYVGGGLFGVAMVGPFVLAIVEADHFWITNGIYLAYVLSALVGTSVKLYAYRRGL